ncbi:MAG: hypothetical protein MZV70_16060 [Desulfobacterales bacterium]|nr:hypothetical protein [Desulfobacterales bacterium]
MIIGALGTGLWNVFISSASRQMHPLLGALITELTAFTAGALIFLPVISHGLSQGFASRPWACACWPAFPCCWPTSSSSRPTSRECRFPSAGPSSSAAASWW